MKRDFHAAINSLEDGPFKDSDGKSLTLKRVCIDAIGAQLEGDRGDSGEATMARYAMAQRIVDGFAAGQPVELTVDELKIIKDRILKVWGVFVIGPAFKLLEADYVEPRV